MQQLRTYTETTCVSYRIVACHLRYLHGTRQGSLVRNWLIKFLCCFKTMTCLLSSSAARIGMAIGSTSRKQAHLLQFTPRVMRLNAKQRWTKQMGLQPALQWVRASFEDFITLKSKLTGAFNTAAPQVAGLIATYLSHSTKPWDDTKTGVERVKAIQDYVISKQSS